LLKARIHEARDKLKDGELLKGFDFEDIDKNGLRNYQVLSKINKSFVDDLAIEWNPIFIQRQLAQRKKFNEIVEFEENKFKEWKKALFSKQNLMNQGIEQMRKEVKVLNEIVHDLQRPIVLKGVVSHSVEDECILDPPGSSSAVLIGVN
jgi:sporulation-regulated protein 3